MKNRMIRAVALGILGGWALFSAPFFILKLILLITFFGLLARIFFSRRMREAYPTKHHCAGRGHFRDRFRNMTPEERNEFCSKMKNRSGRHPHTDEDGIVNPIIK